MKKRITSRMHFIVMFLMAMMFVDVSGQFVHPGIQHKKSDLQRMKAAIDMGMEPWASSFDDLAADTYSQYTYSVKGNPAMTEIRRGVTNNYAYEKDMVAAYQNALMWWLTDDQRHADKAIEILNTWSNLTSVGGIPLDVALYGAPMINAAELIKHSDAGWAEEDMQKFSDMLVYPGYSSTTIPQDDIDTENHTFYWGIYNGDPNRAGNQDLACYKTMLAMGIFLDNDTIYDRALRYITGQKHRPDDLPYESGPKYSTMELSNNGYRILYDWRQEFTIEDYGYDGVLTNYIYDNGQCQESSRDQTHAMYGVSLLSQIAEVAWNQGDDVYSMADNRILKGLEYHLRYNLSFENDYPDQSEPWEPTVESGEFYKVLSRTARNFSLKINPYLDSNFDRLSRGVNITRPYWEMPLNHYINRTHLAPEDYKWLQRGRDLNIAKAGTYEVRSESYTDHPGWGALSYSRPKGCAGDPVRGMESGVPVCAMNFIPTTIEAENFDFFSANGEGFVYHDSDSVNTFSKYRLDESVDIDTCMAGGYMLSDLQNGEWLIYTVAVPSTALYNISIGYAAASAGGKIKFSMGEKDVSSELDVPFEGENSYGSDDWKELEIARDVILIKGIHPLKIHISGVSNAFALNNFTITPGSPNGCDDALEAVETESYIIPGINYSYYEGSWDTMPDFSQLHPVSSGICDAINFVDGLDANNFGMVYSGYIDIPIKGSFTFYVEAPQGTRLYIGDVLVADISGAVSNQEVTTSICLDKGFHAIRLECFISDGNDTLNLMYKGPGVAKTNLQNLYAIGTCDHSAIELSEDAIDGLAYYCYEGEWTSLPAFNRLQEYARGNTSTIDLGVADRSDFFAILFKGYFYIAEEGDYTFYTTSNDGSSLIIDGMPLVINDGVHSDREASGSTCLSEGYHEIRIEYFDNSGTPNLKLEYEGTGLSRSLMSNFKSHPEQGKIPQTITFPAIPTKYLGQDDFDPGATSSAGLPVSYNSYDESIVSIVNGKVHIVGVGTTAIIATQEGNSDYTPAQKAVWVSISPKLNQTIDFADIPTKYLDDADFDPEAVASSGLPLSYLSTDVNVATIVEDKVHIVGAGQTAIFAKQAGNYMYNAAQAAKWLSVERPTHIHAIKDAGIRVYPNPSENMLMIELDELQNARVEVVDFVGKSVFFYSLNSKSSSMDMSSLPEGVYMLRIMMKEKTYTKKFIKR